MIEVTGLTAPSQIIILYRGNYKLYETKQQTFSLVKVIKGKRKIGKTKIF